MSQENWKKNPAKDDRPAASTARTKKVTIVLRARLKNDFTKTQDIEIEYKQGQKYGEVIWAAIEVFKRIGGLIEEVDDGMNFYPMSILVNGVHFSEKRTFCEEESQ